MASLSTRGPVRVVRAPAVAFRLASDARLTALAAAGNQGAMAAIFDRHHHALHRYCYSIVGNEHDAADALQNTMIKALRSLPGETREIALRPWLYRVAHNESISLLRGRRPDADLDAAVHVSDAAAAGVVESRERLRSLTEDLRELTERQRGALLMRELGGLQFTEVAEALQTSAPAAKQSVYEARCALQALQEGRAMDCDSVQRTLSDGDRRMLRGMRMRGHLRDCATCRAFELSLRERPAQLQALIPTLPAAVAVGMLHSILGGSGSGGSGGLAAGLAGTAKAAGGLTVVTKAATAAAVTATLAGGAVYAAPQLRPVAPARSTPSAHTAAGAATQHATPASSSGATARASSRQSASSQRVGAPGSQASRAGTSPASTAARTPAAATVATAPPGAAGAGKPTGTPGEPSRGKPTGMPAGRSTGTSTGKPSGMGQPPTTSTGKPSAAGRPTATSTGRPSGAGSTATTPTRPPSGAGTSTWAPSTAGAPAGTSTGPPTTAGPPAGTSTAGHSSSGAPTGNPPTGAPPAVP